jgi:uncharacterized protein YjdB
MQLFSRKMALVAVSLGALTALGACGDDVTVAAAPDPVVTISITPPNAQLNIGESTVLAVQITGGNKTTPPTLTSCTSSNPAVATAAIQGTASCKVTAVTSGNVTITALASTGNAAAAGITVNPAAAAISGLTVSPTTANLSVGQKATIVPNVNKAAAAVAVTYGYGTSAATIASVNATTGEITAVAPGTATITVTATGTGTGFTNATLTTGVTVNVTAAPNALTGLTVQPQSIDMAVGTTRTISATVTAAPGITVPTPTFTSNALGVATVTAAGVVTAVAPGNAQITVTATSAGNATLAATTLTQIVNVTVSPLANVTIQSIIQGPYMTTGLDSAYSGWNTNPNTVNATPTGPLNGGGVNAVFSGSAYGQIAGIRVAANPQIDQSVDVTNTKDQIQVVLNLQTNSQRVDSVVVYVDPANNGRRAAARQTFSQAPSGNTEVRLYILTEDFTPNAATGVGDVHYSNGLKAISASVWTTLPAGSTAGACPVAITANNTCELQNASAARQNINFNNIDGFALTMVKPANTTLDAASRSWWGGPTSSDIGQGTGVTSFQVWPVIYTPGRSIISVTAGFGRCQGFNAGSGIPNGVVDNSLPYTFTAGTSAPAGSTATHIGCSGIVGAYDQNDNFRFEDYPVVVASLDNSQNPGPRTIYAYNPTLGTDPFGGPRPTLFRNSPQVTAPPAFRVDYEAPSQSLVVSGTNNERWVNDSYSFSSRYTASDNVTFTGVGLFATGSRNTKFFTASANVCGGGQALVEIPGGLAATVASIPAAVVPPNREHPCDFTNNAFAAQVTETDRLGNRGTFGNIAVGNTPASPLYGIDNTAPEILTAWDGASGPIPDMPNHYLATGDSIFQPTLIPAVGPTVPGTPQAVAPAADFTDFYFGIRYRDTRSGFNINNHGTRTVKRFAPNATPLTSNVAVVTTVDTRTMNFVGGTGNPVESEDPTYRRDSITIYGRGPLAGSSTNFPLLASSVVPVGYMQYDITLTDRAGNTNAYRQRAVIDRTSPQVTGVLIPSVFGASGTATAVQQTFIPTGSDDVEAFDTDLFLRYPAFAIAGDSSIGSVVTAGSARVKFRRERGGQSGFANFHNPWQVFSDTLLSTPYGPGAALSSAGMTMPIASLRGIEPVDSTDSPIAWGLAPSNPFAGFKPNLLGIYAYDVRASHRGPTGTPALFPAPYAANPPFANLGESNTFPGFDVAYLEPVFPGNVSNGSRWDVKDLNVATGTADLLVTWSVFAASSSTVQVRATTSTVVTQPPFPTVYLFKWEPDVHHTGSGVLAAATGLVDSVPGNWVYITSMTSAGAPANPSLFDQGSTRFWTYSMTFADHNIGALTQGGTTSATGCYRAVGADASGDGIVTRNFGSACPAVTAVAAGTNATITLRGYGNGAGSIVSTVAPLPFTLSKSSGESVQRVSQNRANVAQIFTIQAASGNTLEEAPKGCSTLSPATYPAPSSTIVTCTVNAGFGPRTITAVFQQTP